MKELKIADSNDHVLVKRVKPNFRELGKRYGKLMKSLAAALNGLSQEQIADLETSGKIGFDLEGTAVEIMTTDVEIISEDMPGWNVASEGRVTVALDITVTDELKKEGNARELVKRIQNYRKTAGFEITDRITIAIESNSEINDAVAEFGDYIKSQVLATEINIVETGSIADGVELDMDNYSLKARIALSK